MGASAIRLLIEPNIRGHANDEQSRPRLRNEQGRVDHQWTVAIPGSREGLADGRKTPAAIGGQRASNVLHRDDTRRAVLGGEFGHELPEREEGA